MIKADELMEAFEHVVKVYLEAQGYVSRRPSKGKRHRMIGRHRKNAGEWVMLIAIAPFVMIARVWSSSFRRDRRG